MATPVSQHTGVVGSTPVDQKGAAGYTAIAGHTGVGTETPVSAHSGVADGVTPYTEIAQK